MTDKIAVKGDGNTTIGGSLIVEKENGGYDLKSFLVEIDEQVRKRIVPSGKIRRGDTEIDYSSEALFTSLIRIGMPVDATVIVVKEIVTPLELAMSDREDKILTPSDIRFAVAECIGGLTFEGRTEGEASMWCAAYVKRYGNPHSDTINVIDHAEDKTLNYEYLEDVVVPHLLRRTLGIGRHQNPLKQFPEVFSSEVLKRMSQEIIFTLNSLDLYSLRYKTLINLMEDVITEPPHPWLVNRGTLKSVVDYNDDRMRFHFRRLNEGLHLPTGTLHQHAKEFFMHASAVLLSRYGSYLGVGEKYGLLELRRYIAIRHKNPAYWDFCKLHDMEKDMKSIGFDVDQFAKSLSRIYAKLADQPNENRIKKLREESKTYLDIVNKLANKAEQDNA